MVAKVDDADVNKINLGANLGIYDEIGDYVPDLSKKEQNKEASKISTKEEDLKKPRNYFGSESSSNSKREFSSSGAISKEAATEFIKNVSEKYAAKEMMEAKKEEKKSGMAVRFDPDSYAECYPGYFSFCLNI